MSSHALEPPDRATRLNATVDHTSSNTMGPLPIYVDVDPMLHDPHNIVLAAQLYEQISQLEAKHEQLTATYGDEGDHLPFYWDPTDLHLLDRLTRCIDNIKRILSLIEERERLCLFIDHVAQELLSIRLSGNDHGDDDDDSSTGSFPTTTMLWGAERGLTQRRSRADVIGEQSENV